MKFAATLSIALLTAAPLTAQGTPLAKQPKASDYTRHMLQLQPIQRAAAIRGAIAQSDQWCRRVMKLGYQGPYKNLEMWVAKCGPKPIVDYGVFIGPDGSVQVSTCGDLIKVHWPACKGFKD
ncbi:hypothetical protein FHS31_001574 [Sphingomonas vulcanisoli]|uniref:Uncharacterized protein n=1 Tax=Sphingomonas vulcanisoli TaxID=1658060 RepID=A0ABX0TT95_9SPHN|nr:hypothetical protein [Sphingomonas vulcanisoli]NIJ07964.1 hypothetical protein [Sphingomonas vulcanisoli]